MEVIDPRNPTLCRVATVNRAEDFKVQIHFDGWPSMYDWWFDFDSMDLHPVGWCQKTGHVLEPPPCKFFLLFIFRSVCILFLPKIFFSKISRVWQAFGMVWFKLDSNMKRVLASNFIQFHFSIGRENYFQNGLQDEIKRIKDF